jgi:hypothetical protein
MATRPTMPRARGAFIAKAAEAMAPPPAAGDMAPLLKRQLAEFAATGLPPPYLADKDPS